MAAPQELWEHKDHSVFTASGRPINPKNIARDYDRTVENADLCQIRVLSLRDTHASLLLQARVSVKVVTERPGDAKLLIALNRVAEALPDLGVDAFEAVLPTANGLPVPKSR